MSGYDGAEFLRRVQAHQLHERGRTTPTGCFYCDVVLPTTCGPSATASMRALCIKVSGPHVDAHHAGAPKQVLKREFPRGARPARAAVGGAALDAEVRDRIVGRPREQLYVPARRGEEPFARELDDLLMDARNGVILRRYCHDLIEAAARAIPVVLLPADTLEFVDELGLRWWLENRGARRA